MAAVTMFQKLLVAKYSPSNRCYVPDGTVLFVRPAAAVRMTAAVPHKFVGAADRKTTSKFAWVKAVTPFTLEQYIAEHLLGEEISADMLKHLEVMLSAIARLSDGTPVGATYFQRGVERRVMEFDVHRVIFHAA